MKTVVLKFEAFSNITYRYEWDTGYTREEWEALTNEEREKEMTDALWQDIDCSDEEDR